jgi:GINS complex subunit 3
MASALAFIPPEGHDYYNIDSIMADEVMVPCTLSYGCTGVGTVIDPSSDANDLAPTSKVELPLWMVPVMARRGLAQVSLPIFYGDSMRRKLRAGPGCEDLHRCPYFYTAALRVHSAMQATGSSDESFPPFIASTFTGRYRELLTKAPEVESDAEITAVQGKLTWEEKGLFNSALAAAGAHDRYRLNKVVHQGPGMRGSKRRWNGGGGGGGGQENKRPSS